MTLAAGSRLGPYEVLAPLGAGGMGEVYRARDTRLGREVAVKVLPAEVANDPDRLRRFEQEARAASALSHPNILALFDVGRDGETSYLVTELLEGRSLREVLSDGGTIPVRRALDWAAQAARGLAAAHEKGIVHRDLKPENLFLVRDGVLKILDFGLARQVASDGSSLAAATTIAGATATGMVMGTAGYMAPEQARGERVDARADLFALGCVLYELLGGRRAFQGESAIETLHAILKSEPPALDGLRPALPPGVSGIVERCLAKEPAARWQSARDLAFRLEEILGGASGDTARTLVPTRAAHRRSRALRAALPWAAALVAVAVSAYWTATHAARAAPIIWQRVTFRRGVPRHARFAPDGRTILYDEDVAGGEYRLASTRLDNPEATRLATPPAELLAVAPDGQLALGLHRESSLTLALASLAGGAAREVLQDVKAADFSPDAARLAVVHAAGDRDVVELPIGTTLYDPGPAVELRNLRFSPTGDRLAVAQQHLLIGPENWDVAIFDAHGKRIGTTGEYAYIEGLAWNPSSGEVWFTAQSAGRNGGIQLHASTPDGHARLVQTVPGLVRLQDILPDGRALLLHSLWPSTMVCRPPGAASEVDLSWLDFTVARDLSDDGRSILVAENGIAWGGDGGVYLRGMDGADAVQLGMGDARELSRDGKWALVHTVGRSGGFVLLPTGAGSPRPLEVPDGRILDARFFPDGRALVVKTDLKNEGRRIYRLDLASGALSPLTSEQHLYLGPITPDGRREVIGGPDGWKLLALDGSGATTPLPGLTGEDDTIRFDSTGEALFVARGGVPLEIRRLEISTGRSTPLFRLGPQFSNGVHSLEGRALSADGSSYCYSYLRDSSDLFVVSGLR